MLFLGMTRPLGPNPRLGNFATPFKSEGGFFGPLNKRDISPFLQTFPCFGNCQEGKFPPTKRRKNQTLPHDHFLELHSGRALSLALHIVSTNKQLSVCIFSSTAGPLLADLFLYACVLPHRGLWIYHSLTFPV